MKVKVTLSSEDGVQWDAEAKDIGLVASGASMMSALEEMQEAIKRFFLNSFESKRIIEVICSKIKATASVTVSPLDPRPERPLECYESSPIVDGQSLIDDPNRLALPPGEEEIEGIDELPPMGAETIIDVDAVPVEE